MAECLEGDWKNFTFKIVTPEVVPAVLTALRKSFYQDEPLSLLVGYSDALGDDLDKFVLSCLNKNEGLSFYAEEKSSGKIAGVRVTSIKRKGEPDPDIDLTEPKMLRIIPILDEVSYGSKIFERYSVDTYAYFVMTAVDPEFRGQGLVTEIYKRSRAMLTAKKFKVCSGVFTSPFTRKAALNLNFDETYFKRIADFVDFNGVQLMPNAGPDQAVSGMALRLTD